VASRLEAPFPNPLNPATTFAFTVDHTQHLTLDVHDVRGRRVAELAAGMFSPGRHEFRWDGRDGGGRSVASGVYLVRLHGDGIDASRTLAVVR
jgi:flagellar hook assembly protein FlgD